MIPGLRRFLGEGKGYPFQYSGLENSKDCIVHGVAKSRTQLSNLGFPDSSVGKESICNAGNPSSIPGSGRSAGEGIGYPIQYSWASLVVQLVKNLPAMQETWVQSLGWEDSLEKGKATHFSIWPREFYGLYSPWGHKKSDTTEQLSFYLLKLNKIWSYLEI